MSSKKFKFKNFTLIGGSTDGFCWRIETKIKDNGTYNSKGQIVIISKEEQRNYLKIYYQIRKDEIKSTTKKYRIKHQNEIKRKSDEYYLNHKEESSKRHKLYNQNHRKEIKIQKMRYYEKHKDLIIERGKEWRINNRTKSNSKSRKHRNKRKRGLNSIELNDWYEGCEGHHIDKEFVLYIPKDLHRSISHNVFSGKNMEEINNLAIEYVYGIDINNRKLNKG